MSTDAKPWHDCPRCTRLFEGLPCCGPLVTTPGRVDLRPGMRLRCCACGEQTVGSDADVARARAADEAHREHQKSGARAAKSFYAAAAEDDTPGPSDELFVRAAVAFAMLMRMGENVEGMAVIVPNLDGMNRDHAVAAIALNFADHPPSTDSRATLFATALPDDYAQALQEAVAGNRRALGLPPQEVEDDAGHICTGCIGDGPCEAEPEEPSVSVDDDADSDGDDWPDADPDAAGSHGGLRIYDGEGSKS